MAGNEKHVKRSDIIAIILSFGFAIFTFFGESLLVIILFYLSMAIFRLLMLILQNIIVRRNDDAKRKFIKERHLSRFAGIILIFLGYAYSAVCFVMIINEPEVFLSKIPWGFAIYIVYALYKFISGYINLKKARRSWSPYREIICVLTFYVAMITMFNAIVLAVSSYFTGPNIPSFFMTLSVIIFIVMMVMSIRLIKSREVPNLLQ